MLVLLTEERLSLFPRWFEYLNFSIHVHISYFYLADKLFMIIQRALPWIWRRPNILLDQKPISFGWLGFSSLEDNRGILCPRYVRSGSTMYWFTPLEWTWHTRTWQAQHILKDHVVFSYFILWLAFGNLYSLCSYHCGRTIDDNIGLCCLSYMWQLIHSSSHRYWKPVSIKWIRISSMLVIGFVSCILVVLFSIL